MAVERRTGARRAPGPRGHPITGSLGPLRRDHLGFLLRVHRTYGDIVRLRLGPIVAHLISHPEDWRYVLATNQGNYCKGPDYDKLRPLLGNGLLTSEGDFW